MYSTWEDKVEEKDMDSHAVKKRQWTKENKKKRTYLS